MKTKPVIILAVVAVATIAVAAVLSRHERVESPGLAETARRPMFEGLEAQLPQVAAITVKHGDKEFTVNKGAQAWTVAEKGGYPAKPDEVRKALVGMAELQRSQPMTAKPDLYSKIGVQDPDGKPVDPMATTPSPTLVTFKDDKGQPLASAIIGQQKYSGNKRGVYVRKTGDAQSWLAEGELDVADDPVRWIDAFIVQIPQDRIRGVTVTQPDGQTMVISRDKPDQKSYTLQGMPAGKELKTPTEPDAVPASIVSLNLDDVAPLSSIDFTGQSGAKAGPYSEYRTFDGLVLAVQFAEKDNKTWASFAAHYEPPAGAEQPKPEAAKPDAKPDSATPPGEKPAEKPADAPADKKPGEKSADEVKKEVDDLNTKLARFAFAIPSYKAEIMKRKMADLLKSDQPPPPPPAMQGTTPLFPPAPTGSAPTGPVGPAPVPPAPKPAETPPTAPTGPTGSTGAPPTTPPPPKTGG